MVRVAEVLDPRNHGSRRQPVAFPRGSGFEIEHTRQRLTVPRPAAAMGEKVFCLCGTRASIRMGEVIPSADQASARGTGVMRREGGVDERCPFGGLIQPSVAETNAP
jgi:hypothetical protein